MDDVSLSFPETGFVALSGKSGCGKTTLLNLIGLIDGPTSGRIVIDGVEVDKADNRTRAMLRSDKIGYVFQEDNLLDDLSIYENLLVGAEISGQKVDSEEIRRTLSLVDLPTDEAFLGRKARELSGGQKQRVSIVRAILKKTSILLCDEPTVALDEENSGKVFSLLKRLSEKILVICVTHELESAREYADRIIMLKDGRVSEDTVIRESRNHVEKSRSPKRSSLDWLISFHVAFRGIFKKKVRLVLSFATIFLSLLLSTCYFSVNMDDLDRVQFRSMTDQGYSTYLISHADIYDGTLSLSPYGFSYEQNARILTYTQRKACRANGYIRDSRVSFGDDFSITNQIENVFFFGYSYAVEIDEDSLSYLNLTLDPRITDPGICHVPKEKGEVAITDFVADFLVEHHCHGVNDLMDLFSMDYCGNRIVAIYRTEVDKNTFRRAEEEKGMTYLKYLQVGANPLLFEFVPKYSLIDPNEAGLPFMYAIRYDGDYHKTRAFLDSLTYSGGGNEVITYIMDSPFFGFTHMIENIRNPIRQIAVFVMPVLILLSVLILTNFILANMGETKRSFALLKLMGIHDFQIGKITFLQASILLASAVFLSLIGLAIALVSFNHIFGLSVFSFHPLILVILFLVSLVFSLCSSLLSLVFFNRKSLVQLLD